MNEFKDDIIDELEKLKLTDSNIFYKKGSDLLVKEAYKNLSTLRRYSIYYYDRLKELKKVYYDNLNYFKKFGGVSPDNSMILKYKFIHDLLCRICKELKESIIDKIVSNKWLFTLSQGMYIKDLSRILFKAEDDLPF